MAIFIDANVFIAYSNKDDQFHERAVVLMEKIDSMQYGLPFSSDYVFDETVTITLKKTRNKNLAIKIGNMILSGTKMMKMNGYVLNKAWHFFKSLRTKMSFTDLTNIVFLELMGDNKIATFDEEFKKVPGIKVVT